MGSFDRPSGLPAGIQQAVRSGFVNSAENRGSMEGWRVEEEGGARRRQVN